MIVFFIELCIDPFQTAVKMGLHRHPILVFEEHPDMDNTHWLTDLPVMSCKKHKVGPTPGELICFIVIIVPPPRTISMGNEELSASLSTSAHKFDQKN